MSTIASPRNTDWSGPAFATGARLSDVTVTVTVALEVPPRPSLIT
ncbi:MAG: hypothetical protein R6W83_12735 [Cryobacterium sp.]